MRRLADRLGVKAPSLYKHLAGKEDLEAALMAVGLEQVASVLGDASRGAPDPLAAIPPPIEASRSPTRTCTAS